MFSKATHAYRASSVRSRPVLWQVTYRPVPGKSSCLPVLGKDSWPSIIRRTWNTQTPLPLPARADPSELA